MSNSEISDLASEMKEVKLLLILQLLKSGVQQKHIAKMLGFSTSKMSAMMPPGLTKELGKLAPDEEG